jgi:hypothetical protein
MNAVRNKPLGYAWLVDRYQLPVRPLPVEARVDPAVKGRSLQRRGDRQVLAVEPSYDPGEALAAHLQFALRYEGINLELLALLFQRTGRQEINEWLGESPTSAYARRAGFLYEWLTGSRLAPQVPARTRYVSVLDTDLQFGPGDGPRDTRYRVINNLPGTPSFCPLVRKTDFLKQMVRKDLRSRTQETLASYDNELLRRAASFLYLKETHSSFEVEREKPAPERAQRFVDLLQQAETGQPLTESRLVELQNAVVDPRFHEFTWRSRQNWVGTDLGYRKKVAFVPPRPEDVPALMSGLLELAALARRWGQPDSDPDATMDAVVLAAAISFGFVFIHPFMDGNGRIHRYLIHEVLANAGFTPRGIILPVSAVILAHMDEYTAALESFSRPMLARTQFVPDAPDAVATGNDELYFRFFDATEQAEFLYQVLERTITEDLRKEVQFLLGFDRARRVLNDLLDWPNHSLDLFIRVVHQNGGTLSRAKRESHFSWMTDDEVKAAEQAVAQAFAEGDPNPRPARS